MPALPTSCPGEAAPSSNGSSTHFHMVGIAGSGMRSLAEVLLRGGHQLTGSDADPSPARRLRRLGCRLWRGSQPGRLGRNCQALIYSDAIDADHPERRVALQRGIPTLSYPQMLGRLMQRADSGIAIAGTHGKSTTTAMTAEILIRAGRDPTVVCGAEPRGWSSGGRHGSGHVVLAEACEYRRNFLHLHPTTAVILGIEPDHFDCYAGQADLQAAFADLARRLPAGGLLLAHAGCAATIRAARACRGRVRTFGFAENADWQACGLDQRDGRYGFTIVRDGWPMTDVRLRVPGRHNVLNALTAAAVAGEHGVPGETIGEALSAFGGVRRRFEHVGSIGGVTLIDDYAHHPTAVSATLSTVRQVYSGRRVWCVFEPHQASRTARLLDEFAAGLQNADEVLVAEVYRARESAEVPRGDVTAADLLSAARSSGCRVHPGHEAGQLIERLADRVAPGDVVVTLGAGRIRNICDGLADRLRRHRAHG